MQVLLDTHAWVWSLVDDPMLSPSARQAVASADAVFVSPVSLFEISQKVRIGKWPEMEDRLDGLPGTLAEQGGLSAALTLDAALYAGKLEWAHRDPFDRILAATAVLGGLALVSADAVFDSFPDPGLNRIW
ncbi:MAG: type II toxin-antitoxin system VapC family toxin [Boseongicola sp. SB0662_bin_57]|nr:type II toxin-antitoxin system VapC family toxin [Boseongicola sp. SB0662_bin_57]